MRSQVDIFIDSSLLWHSIFFLLFFYYCEVCVELLRLLVAQTTEENHILPLYFHLWLLLFSYQVGLFVNPTMLTLY